MTTANQWAILSRELASRFKQMGIATRTDPESFVASVPLFSGVVGEYSMLDSGLRRAGSLGFVTGVGVSSKDVARVFNELRLWETWNKVPGQKVIPLGPADCPIQLLAVGLIELCSPGHSAIEICRTWSELNFPKIDSIADQVIAAFESLAQPFFKRLENVDGLVAVLTGADSEVVQSVRSESPNEFAGVLLALDQRRDAAAEQFRQFLEMRTAHAPQFEPIYAEVFHKYESWLSALS